VHNKNDFSLQQSALFGGAHQPADGSALKVRCHACAAASCTDWVSAARLMKKMAALAEQGAGELGHGALLVPAEWCAWHLS
jgi:hypothetical protein